VEHSSRAAGRRRLPGPVALLALLLAVGSGLRLAAALALHGPFILPDESAYALLGRALWHRGELAALGGPAQYVSALYPVVSGLPYAALRVVQVLVLCATAGIVYCWARGLARPAWALTAAALTLALPGLAYAGTIVAESLFVPVATLAAWLGMRALADPSRLNQALLVVALVAAGLVAGEANALVLALLAAAVAVRRVRALWPAWAAAAGFCVVWLALGGGSPLRSLGSFGASHYSARAVVVWVLEHAGDLLLVCGAVPFAAVVLLALERRLDKTARATVTFALALALVTAVEVGVFAAGHAGMLLERDLLFALPPLFVGFAAWLERGAPRPRAATLLVLAAVVAALLAMPFGRLATTMSVNENPTLVPLAHLGSAKTYGVVALFAIAAAVLALALPRRRIWILPVLLTALFAATAVSAAEEFGDRSQRARQTYAAPAAHWIDRAARTPVTYLYDGTDDFRVVWSQLFWNTRIDNVIDLPATHLPGPLPQRQLQIVRDDGALRLVGGRRAVASAVVAPEGFRFRGTLVSHSVRLGLSLWRVQQPLRLRTWVQGLQPNGDLLQGGVATIDVFDCGRGTFHVVAVGRDNETLTLSKGGTPLTTTNLWPDGVWEQSVATPAARPATQCTFSLASTSLVHLAAFEWTPAPP
jgi:hypothetical protein